MTTGFLLEKYVGIQWSFSYSSHLEHTSALTSDPQHIRLWLIYSERSTTCHRIYRCLHCHIEGCISSEALTLICRPRFSFHLVKWHRKRSQVYVCGIQRKRRIECAEIFLQNIRQTSHFNLHQTQTTLSWVRPCLDMLTHQFKTTAVIHLMSFLKSVEFSIRLLIILIILRTGSSLTK